MFGIASRVRSFLSYSGTDDGDYDEYEYETDGATVSETSEEDPREATEDDPEETIEIESAPENVLDIESVQDIKGLGETRASRLDRLGFNTPSDVYFADDEELTEADGIGPYTVEQIRDDVGSPEE